MKNTRLVFVTVVWVGCSPSPTTNDGGVDAGSDVQNVTDSSNDVVPMDASDAATFDYHDMSTASLWESFDLQQLGQPSAHGYIGGAFDGRYVYFAPNYTGGVAPATPTHRVLRFDTTGTFKNVSSWATIDTTTLGLGNSLTGFGGIVFDGRYVYFVPYSSQWPSTSDQLVLRYDTMGQFTDTSKWSLAATSYASPYTNAGGFQGAVFDGRYVMFVPNGAATQYTGLTARYDTQGDFADAAAWSSHDLQFGRFEGGIFDGRYAYFVPNGNGTPTGTVARYDTQAPFDTGWSTYDVEKVDPNAHGFIGGAFDGRYVYLIPNHDQTQPLGVIARYDTTATFTASASWSTFDLTTVHPNALGFRGAIFDGRYIYCVPYENNSVALGLVARYDTQAPFATKSSWSTFDMTTVDPNATGFFGGVFDGRYVYFTPYDYGPVVRFDAKTPSAMPALPAFHGSFF